MKISKHDKFDIGADKAFIDKIKHDILLKFIDCEMRFQIYKVIYTYKTIRGNLKENYRYLIAEDDADAMVKFMDYIKKSNEEKPYRAISNVKILDVVYTADVLK